MSMDWHQEEIAERISTAVQSAVRAEIKKYLSAMAAARIVLGIKISLEFDEAKPTEEQTDAAFLHNLRIAPDLEVRDGSQ